MLKRMWGRLETYLRWKEGIINYDDDDDDDDDDGDDDDDDDDDVVDEI